MSRSVKHIIEKDLMTRQLEAEKAMLKELESGDYTIGNPLVKLNPYLISPLAAVVLFRTERETAVTVTVRGKTPAGDITHVFPAARTHILPVLGLYPDYANTVDIRLYQGPSAAVTIETEPAAGAAELDYMRTTAEHWGDTLIVLTPAGFGRLTGFDHAGDIRWYISAGLQMGLKRLRNGRLLIGADRIIRPPYYATGLYELDMVGKIYAEYQVPGGYHHDQLELPDGYLLILSDDLSAGSRTVEDVCVLVDRKTGAVKKTWDFKALLTPGEGASGLATEEDWFHCNALWYDEKTRSLTFSSRHLDAIVNIDFETGALRWILGDPEGWPEDRMKYFFTPAGDGAFTWQYAQHACLITPDGDVMCFDNGTLRSKIREKQLKNKDNFSRGVRFRINTEDRTVRQVWEYGRERGPAFFSQHISNVDYLGEDHYLVHSGGILLVDGEPADGLAPPGPGSKTESACVTAELHNGKTVLELRCKSNYFRALKLPLYHDGSNLDFGPGRRLGGLAPTDTSDITVPPSSGGLLPEDASAHIVEESDRLVLKARFDNGKPVSLLLAQGDEVKAYPVNTEDKFASFTGMPYLEPDPRNTSTTIHKAGLAGSYGVKVLVGGTVYETGVTVTC